MDFAAQSELVRKHAREEAKSLSTEELESRGVTTTDLRVWDGYQAELHTRARAEGKAICPTCGATFWHGCKGG